MKMSDGHLRIAMLAPPWIAVPPPAYGGIEAVIHLLCEGLVECGHEVTLFAAPGSQSRANVFSPLETPHEREIGAALYEADHVGSCFHEVARAADARPYDVIHDHCGSVALVTAPFVRTPIVHTVHGPFVGEMVPFYRRHGRKATIVGLSHDQLSRAPMQTHGAHVVPNPIDARSWPLRTEKEDYALWIGRMSPDKGPHRAIDAAVAADTPLVLAGPVQPGQEEYFRKEVQPRVDGERVRYLGQIAYEEKGDLFAGARAMLMPIRWPEPFGMVMIEALACGTPVIAFPEGSAPEIVDDGRTGFLVRDEEEMAARIGDVSAIDPTECRREALERFDVPRVVELYESAYRDAIARRTRRRPATRAVAATAD
jgi:glycosyltransferase involved in cell wall biosynthesis